ncbi:MAG: SURF1 family protein [Pigmentiphaga sp.]|uniref:SURF1 family protein n=1 Tax=Pigmentiphaga sp. TaxID=1977564 RepID=UPI0029BD0EF3|nr:SURF1 family protein [Pigmentiphaga sp.]MDX3907968.1 SURF1 family protein [Pigmentiphaga sp.]
MHSSPAGLTPRPRRHKIGVALVLLALTVAATVALGRWQLQRAEEKRGILASVEAGRQLAPLQLTAGLDRAELVPWRPAAATGRWLAERTVLLENRMAQGRPGFWVVTPLALERGGGAVAVLRGWVPRPVPDAPVMVDTPTGPVTVRGELIPQIPRLLDLGALGGHPEALPRPWPGPGSPPPRMQNLDLPSYGEAAGVGLLPVVLEQTGDAPDGLVREWAGPPTNVDTHRGYALQWFSFAAIAAIAFGVLLVRSLRSTH